MKKKIAVILLSAIMVLSILSGCTKDEMGFMSLTKEVNEMKVSEGTGTYQLKLEGPGLQMALSSEEVRKLPQEIKKLFKGIEFKYDLKQDTKNMLAEITMDARFIGEKQYRPFTKMIIKKDKMYMKMDDVFKFIKPYILLTDPQLEKEIDEFIKNVEYVDITSDEQQQYSLNQNTAIKIMNIFKDAFSDLDEIEFNVVKKVNNGYKVSIDTKALNEIVQKLTKYFIQNKNEIFNKVVKGINKLTDEEIKDIAGVSGDTIKSKQDIINGLKEMKKEIDQMKAEDFKIEELDEVLEQIKNSKIDYTLTKEKDKYNFSTNFILDFNGLVKMTVKEDGELKPVKSVKINVPKKTTPIEKLVEMEEKNSLKVNEK